MRDIVAKLGTTKIPRLRIGIGRPENESMDLKDFVLSKIGESAMQQLDASTDEAMEILFNFCKESTNENS